MATRILVIQPDRQDPPGPLGDWLAEAGAELEVVLPRREPLPEDISGYQGLVCLGGGMSATDDQKHTWLPDVRRMLAGAAARELPTLAVCLGSQLLAVALGGRCETGKHGAEVGPGLIAKRDAGWADPLFADLPLMPDVLQFHGDAITRLPPSAVLLAASTRYPNQAFRAGRCAYGLQFHIETTPRTVLSWAESAPTMAAAARPDDLSPQRLAELHRDIEQTWRPFASRFVGLASGELQPVGPDRPGLPLADG